MRPSYLDRLNPEQRRAVEHGVGEVNGLSTGPLLVIAGAGSGKTSTLAHRVAHLIVSGADPRRVLLMTFSRRAAAEMTRRAERILRSATGRSAAAGTAHRLSWAGTFHAIGARLLRTYANEIGLDPAFTIHDREDSADLLNLVRHRLGFSKTPTRFPLKGTCLAIYSRCVNGEVPIEEVLRTSFPWCGEWADALKKLFAAYVEAKQRQWVLDYDNLLLYWAQMMTDQGLAAEIGGRFDHVLVDEYQDTNRLQASILLALKPDGAGLTVVGDDAQSIYSFRAATVQNILDFPGRFSPPAEIVTLAQNYRSTPPILAAANAVIGLASERFTKNLWTNRSGGERPQLVAVPDEADQARYVVERMLESREAGIKLKQQAVLFRASHHSGPLEIELTRRNIPFVKFGGEYHHRTTWSWRWFSFNLGRVDRRRRARDQEPVQRQPDHNVQRPPDQAGCPPAKLRIEEGRERPSDRAGEAGDQGDAGDRSTRRAAIEPGQGGESRIIKAHRHADAEYRPGQSQTEKSLRDTEQDEPSRQDQIGQRQHAAATAIVDRAAHRRPQHRRQQQ